MEIEAKIVRILHYNDEFECVLYLQIKSVCVQTMHLQSGKKHIHTSKEQKINSFPFCALPCHILFMCLPFLFALLNQQIRAMFHRYLYFSSTIHMGPSFANIIHTHTHKAHTYEAVCVSIISTMSICLCWACFRFLSFYNYVVFDALHVLYDHFDFENQNQTLAIAFSYLHGASYNSCL